MRAHPIIVGAIHQFATGIAFPTGAGEPEHAPPRLDASQRMAIGYLVVFGSIVGYSAYIYAMDKLPVAQCRFTIT